MTATEFDALAQLTLADCARARDRFEPDLAQALDGNRGPAGAGIPQLLQDAAREGTLMRLLVGERTGATVRARAYRVTLSTAKRTAEYLHTVCVDAADAVSYLGVRPLHAERGSSRHRVHWNLDYSILAKLRWFGFAQQYALGDSARFAIRRDRWEGWSESEREQAIARVRRLARETNVVVLGIDRPLPLTISATESEAASEPPEASVYRRLQAAMAQTVGTQLDESSDPTVYRGLT